jgi:hypothetical protein
MNTFTVSDVKPRRTPFQSVALQASIAQHVRLNVEACASNLGNLVRADIHPLVQAAHFAFAGHLPLALSPDDIWLCIVQAFGAHVNADTGALRARFGMPEGKRLIEITRNDFRRGSTKNDWPGAVKEFVERIADYVPEMEPLVVGDFSTTGAIERTAYQTALMSVTQRWFDYSLFTMCGIPEIRLLGTPEDWISLRMRARNVARFGLQDWMSELKPVLDQFVAASQGQPDAAFWQSFYKDESQSGGPFVTGWINVLFPYLDNRNTSGAGTLTADGLRRNPFALAWRDSSQRTTGPHASEFPAGLQRAPFLWHYLSSTHRMQLVSGFVALSQDPATFELRPAIGWAVCEQDEGQALS